jgi:hypothetical protein
MTEFTAPFGIVSEQAHEHGQMPLGFDVTGRMEGTYFKETVGGLMVLLHADVITAPVCTRGLVVVVQFTIICSEAQLPELM